MNQYDLNRAVAQATGESVATIAALGFSLLSPAYGQNRERRARRRKHPLRLIREPRKRSPHKKPPQKSSTGAKTADETKRVARHPGTATAPLPPIRLANFHEGA